MIAKEGKQTPQEKVKGDEDASKRDKNHIQRIQDNLINAIKNRNFNEAAVWASELAKITGTEVNITATGSLIGVLGPGYLGNMTVDASGNVKISVGLGIGVGEGITITTGSHVGETGPISVNVTIVSPAGKACGKIGFEGEQAKGALGYGIGIGVSLTVTGEIININIKDK